jgi:hypothetical protein
MSVPVHYTVALMSAPVHLTGAHSCAPVQLTGAPLSAPYFPTHAHTCALFQGTGAHSCTPSTESPAHVDPPSTQKPPKTPVRPPVPTLPKNLKPIAMQDVQTTNLNLTHRETDAWCSQNHSISSGSALELTVAAGTNEVAMWALQLYIGVLPNFHSPFLGAHGVHFSNRLQPRDQRPAAYIMTIPGPLFTLSPRGTFFPHHGQVRTRIVTFFKYKLIPLILFRYCSLWVFGCYVCRYLLIGHRRHPFRYIFSTGM